MESAQVIDLEFMIVIAIGLDKIKGVGLRMGSGGEGRWWWENGDNCN